jgi:hypothetical protein
MLSNAPAGPVEITAISMLPFDDARRRAERDRFAEPVSSVWESGWIRCTHLA